MANETRLTFQELIDFIEHRMRMSHIYQLLLIRTLFLERHPTRAVSHG